jgi:hypothetical protein
MGGRYSEGPDPLTRPCGKNVVVVLVHFEGNGSVPPRNLAFGQCVL